MTIGMDVEPKGKHTNKGRAAHRKINVELDLKTSMDCEAIANEFGEKVSGIKAMVKAEALRRLAGLNAREVYASAMKDKLAKLEQK